MADVTLTYKGSDILELSDSGSATLKTGGTYCEADIGVEYVKPSGGGSLPSGISAIATGTFILADDVESYTITHNLGVKPRVLIAWCGQYEDVNYIKDYTKLKTLEVVLSKLGTTSSNQNNNVGVMAQATSSGNISRIAYIPSGTDITDSTAVIKGTSSYPLTSTISTSSETTVATWYWIAVAE